MKRIILLSALMLSALTVNAQYSVGSYPCGPASTSPLQCNGFPVSLNGLAIGTGWLHTYLTGSGPNYILWETDLSLMPEAIINKTVCVTTDPKTGNGHTAPQCTFLVVYFSGGGSPGDVDYYTGMGTFHFGYTYSAAQWRRTLTAGALKFVTY